MIAFISGHLDLTQEEFDEHYTPHIFKAVDAGFTFVVGDAKGCDLMAQTLLGSIVPLGLVKVYHMFDKPRNNWGFKTVGGFTSDKERDTAMTLASDYDIAWVRPGSRKNSGTAQNIKRREKLKPLQKNNWETEIITKYDFSLYHTKVLMRMLDDMRNMSEWEYECLSETDKINRKSYREALKTELAKRPHVPNKLEAKKLRQEAAKRKR